MDWRARAQRNPMARITGVVYLLYFPTAILAYYLSLSIEGLGIVAEASLMLWLIPMGVNDRRWKEQAGTA